MNRNSRIVAFAAVFALAGLALPAAAADRRGDGGTPQQGMSNVYQSGPVEAQAKYQADYHADYRAKGTQDEKDAKTDERTTEGQRERDRRAAPAVDRSLGRAPGAWGR
jgi:hypothetical protein